MQNRKQIEVEMLDLALFPKSLYTQRGGQGLRVDLINIMANNKEDLEDKDDVEHLEGDNDEEDFLDNNANVKDNTKREHDSAYQPRRN
jgi:hypothetical protein